MASIQYSKLIGSGPGLDYVDQILGKCSYTIDLGPKARASTTNQVCVVIDLSIGYTEALAYGVGEHAFDGSKGYNRLMFGFAAAPSGADIKAPNLPLDSYGTGYATTKRVIGNMSAINRQNYTLNAVSGGIILHTAGDYYRSGDFVVDSNSPGITGTPSILYPEHRTLSLFAPESTTTLRTGVLGMCLRADGGTIRFYMRSLYAGDTIPAVVTQAQMASRAREFIIGPTNYEQYVGAAVVGGDAGAFLRSHPYLFIQWPHATIPLNIHNVYASFQT